MIEEVKKILRACGCLPYCDCEECEERANLISKELCQLFEQGASISPPEAEGAVGTYVLNCDKCGEPFCSPEAFPSPQLCSRCSKPDEGRLLTDEQKPWDKENWHQAKGIKVKRGETNSAFAERDYSIKCESRYLIAKAKGYWIWWCSIHHQPLAWCNEAKTASIARAECQERVERIVNCLDLLLRLHPLRGGSLKKALVEYVQALKKQE